MIDFIETHVEFILEFIHVLFPLDQAIISPLLQSMLGFRQAIFGGGGVFSDWVADLKKGLHSLYVYCPLVEP